MEEAVMEEAVMEGSWKKACRAGNAACENARRECCMRRKGRMITFVRNCADVLECVSRDFLGQSGEKSNQTKRP